jgi:lipocalin
MGPNGYREYPKIDMNLQATIQFDGNVKIIGNDVYFTLAEFKRERSGSDNEVKEFDEALREIDRYVGKTYKVSTTDAEIENPAELFKYAEAVFQVLETKSLVEVAKMKGNAYVLQPKKSTMQAINIAMGKKKNAGLSNSYSTKNDPVEVTYQKNSTGGILRVTSTKNKKNYAQLTRESGEYTLEAKNVEMNRRYKSGSNFEMMMKRDFLMLKASEINSYSSTWYDISWKDKQLAAKLTTQTKSYYDENGGTKVESYGVKGPLDLWTGNMDLSFVGNGKEYGKLMIQAQPTTRSFQFNFAIDMGMSGNVKINGEGTSNFEKGTVEITAPTVYEEIRNF